MREYRYSRKDHFKCFLRKLQLEDALHHDIVQMLGEFQEMPSFLPFRYMVSKMAERSGRTTGSNIRISDIDVNVYDPQWKQICDQQGWTFIATIPNYHHHPLSVDEANALLT